MTGTTTSSRIAFESSISSSPSSSSSASSWTGGSSTDPGWGCILADAAEAGRSSSSLRSYASPEASWSSPSVSRRSRVCSGVYRTVSYAACDRPTVPPFLTVEASEKPLAVFEYALEFLARSEPELRDRIEPYRLDVESWAGPAGDDAYCWCCPGCAYACCCC